LTRHAIREEDPSPMEAPAEFNRLVTAFLTNAAAEK
jgi:hypothetical protein